MKVITVIHLGDVAGCVAANDDEADEVENQLRYELRQLPHDDVCLDVRTPDESREVIAYLRTLR